MVLYLWSRQVRVVLLVCMLAAVVVSALAVLVALHYPSREFVVHRTASGFEPTELRIPVGATVVFVNEIETGSWPASDLHPTHAGYPVYGTADCLGSAFDACKALGHNERWSFDFTEYGDWRYHDHLAPSQGGRIVVMGTFAYLRSLVLGEGVVASPIVDRMLSPEVLVSLDATARIDALRRFAHNDPDAAWQLVKEVATRATLPAGFDVHQLGHIVGSELYVVSGWEGFLLCDDALTYACSHGFIEEAVRVRGANAVTDIATQCEASMRTQDAYADGSKFPRNCFHGVGHGLASLHAFDLPASLDHCVALFSDVRALRNCQFGVFMEYYMSSPLADFTADDPWALCSSLSSDQQYACADAMPSIVGRSKASIARSDTFTLCMSAPTDSLRLPCVHRAGRALGDGAMRDVTHVLTRCHALPSAYSDECLFATALGIVGSSAGTSTVARTEIADRLCDAATDSLRAPCRAAIRDEVRLNYELYALWKEYPL